MTERREAVRRPAGAPLPRRSRKRWAVAGGVAAGWVVLLAVTGSAVGAVVALAVIAALGVVGVAGLRALGVTRDHPWVRRMAARPWRDGQDVLQLALRHLSDVFVVTPSGSLLAPNVVEVQLNPDDLRSLCERMEPGLISASAAEVYEEHVAARAARFAQPGPIDVRVIAGPSVPAGRYHLRQGQPVGDRPEPSRDALPYPGFAGHDGSTCAEPVLSQASGKGMLTVMERARHPIPLLRLVTGDSTAETRMSGARAGRGAVDLQLPDVPTVSREHARFTFSDGQWWIANLGMNGLTINGAPAAGEHPLSDGDSIRWGTRPDALLSRVEIS